MDIEIFSGANSSAARNTVLPSVSIRLPGAMAFYEYEQKKAALTMSASSS